MRVTNLRVSPLLAFLFLAVALTAFSQNTISTFVGCLNNKLTVAANLQSGDVNNVNIADTVQCLPQGCKMTLDMSGFSDQKAGTIQGVQLPRILLNCPGPGDGQRLHPEYSLWPSNINPPLSTSNNIEIGEDSAPAPPIAPLILSNIKVVPGQNWPNLNTLATIDSQDMNNFQCTSCHKPNPNSPTVKYPANAVNQVTAFLEPVNDPFGTDVAFGGLINGLPNVINTNEPNRIAIVNPGGGAMAQTLSSICTAISQLNPIPPGINLSLCQKMVNYQQNSGCRTGVNNSCNGVTGGGLFRNAQGAVSSVSVDFSGQTSLTYPDQFTTAVNFLDRDGTLSAINYGAGMVIQSTVLKQLTGQLIVGGSFSFTGSGTAMVSKGGAAAQLTNVCVTIQNLAGISFSVTDIGGGTCQQPQPPPAGTLLIDAATPVAGAALNFN
jgi:hypothetical protein